MVHSFLEGSILVHTPEVGDMSQNFYAIVVGVALHHMPAAFALATLLRLRLGSFRRVWPGLLIFALASPVGIVVSNYVVLSQLLSGGCTRRCWAWWPAISCTFPPPSCSKPAPSTASTGPSWALPWRACCWRWPWHRLAVDWGLGGHFASTLCGHRNQLIYSRWNNGRF